MQKYNLKAIKKDLNTLSSKVQKQSTWLSVLAFSNLLIWLVLIINYFLQG